MKKLIAACLLGIISMAAALTPEEFEQLYTAPKKNGEVCFKLYQAYAQGDGVEQNDVQARKWLLAAHRCGVEGTREELAKLPWRKAHKGKKSIKIVKVDDAKARELGEKLVRYLLSLNGNNSGVGIDTRETLLTHEQTKRVREFIADGADLNTVVKEGKYGIYSALSIACHRGDLALAKLLIDHGADPCACSALALEYSTLGYLPHMRAAAANATMAGEVARSEARMRKQGLKNLKNKPKKIVTVGPYPATSAQEKLSVAVVDFLLKNGMEVDMWTEYGWTVASMLTNAQDVRALMAFSKQGMDLNRRQNPHECVSALYDAERMKYLKTVGGVDAGYTPLTLAVRGYNDHIVECLLRLNADVTVQTGDGCSLTDLTNKADEALKNSSNEEYKKRLESIREQLKKALNKAKK